MDDDLIFEYEEDTSVYGGCGTTLMGEMWYFGGFPESMTGQPNQKRQVGIIIQYNYKQVWSIPYGII